jgi:spermidine synthase
VVKEGMSRSFTREVAYLVLVCFFFSGVTGLIYEILWTRMVVAIIGSSPFIISMILTVFMGGLGLGSFLASRTIDHVREPMKLVKTYGMLESAIGAYGLAIPAFLVVFRPLYGLLYNQLFSHFILYNFLVFLGCCILLCVPVICMGATLPILCRFYIVRLSHLGTHAGVLYGLNTVGAALGALLCGFWLINLLGVWGTLILAVFINGTIGLSCILVSFKARGQQGGEEQAAAESLQYSQEVAAERSGVYEYRGALAGALIIFAISGFCAMAYEVIWTKLLGLIVGPTTYSFTIVLVTFIFGLALGSMFFGWLADKTRQVIWLLLFTQATAGLSVLAVSQLLGNSQMFFAKLIFQFSNRFATLNISKAAILFVFMFLPTFCLGATFPLVGKIYTKSVSTVGKSIGLAYMVNTIGAVSGSFAAGFILIPLVGQQGGLRIAIALQLFTSLVITGVILNRNRQNFLKALPAAVLALPGLFLCFGFPSWDYNLHTVGRYHRFDKTQTDLENTSFLQALLQGPEILARAQRGELVYHADGLSGFTAVRMYPNPLGGNYFALTISGKPDASSHADMMTQSLLAHFPMLFHPNPKKVMVLGLASGITAGEVLYYPVDQLDVIDINRQMVAASDFFIPWNNNVLSNKKTNLIIQDGRAHLQLTKQKYDVIISEPSNPWMAGLAALFTRDFFVLARNALNDNGIFVQFMYVYQMDWPTFSIVGRTFAQVFPNSMMISTEPSGKGDDYLLIGFKGVNKLNLENAERRISYTRQSKDVTLTDPRLLYRLIVSEDLQKLFGQGPINTDNRPRLEFAAPRLMYRDDTEIRSNLISKVWLRPETKSIVEQAVSDVNEQIDFAAYALSVNAPFKNMVDLSKTTAAQKERFFKLAEAYCARDMVDFALFGSEELTERCREIQIDRIEKNIELMPSKSYSYFYLADLYSEQNKLDKAVANYLNTLRLKPDDSAAHVNLGAVLSRQGDLDGAIRHFEEALQIRPGIPEVHRNLGVVLARQNKLDQAVSHYNEALRIKPDFASARRELGDILTGQGKYDQAVAEYKEVLRLFPEDQVARNSLGIAFAKQGKFDEAVIHFSEVLQMMPDFRPALRNFRYVLEQQQNPEKVIYLAKQACDTTNYENPFLLVDLAGSYAAAGRFSEAVSIAEKALQPAQSLGNQKLTEEIQNRLQSYRQGRPYVQAAPER